MSVDAFVIRGYRESDLEDCRALWTELTQRHRDLYDDQSIGGEDPGSHFVKHLAEAGADRIWVAVSGDDIVGMTGLLEQEDNLYEVEPVIVRKDMCGKGLGRKLVEHAIQQAKELNANFISVRPVMRNADAIKFFHSCGFDNIGHVELFIDLKKKGKWRKGIGLAGLEFDF